MTRVRWLRAVRTRIAVTVAIAVTASSIAAAFVAYRVESSDAQDRFRFTSVVSAGADAEQAARIARAEPTDAAALASVEYYVQQRAVYNTIAGYDIIQPGVATSGCHAPLCTFQAPNFLRRPMTKNVSAFYWTDDGRTLITAQTVERNDTTRFLLVETHVYGDAQQHLAHLRTDLARLVAIAVLCSVVLGLAVAIGISRPVRRTALAAQRLGAGDLDTRIPVHGSGELAELATNFNTMAQRLSDTLSDLRLSQTLQHRFVADVSHELRTPLAAMLAAGEGLDSADHTLRTRAATLMREQVHRMAVIVDDLLEMSRFDAGQATLHREPVDLAVLAHDVVGTVAPNADVHVTAIGDTTVAVDAARIHTILRNLVANACQHGAPPVQVGIDARSNRIVITVSDGGPGVPADLIDTVFDRFVRANTARTSPGGGTSTGLGLAIAAENAHLHNATLAIAPDESSTFILRIPKTHTE